MNLFEFGVHGKSSENDNNTDSQPDTGKGERFESVDQFKDVYGGEAKFSFTSIGIFSDIYSEDSR